MGRAPHKTEEVRVRCGEDLKAEWNWFQTYYEDNEAALRALLSMVNDNPELVEAYR